MTNGDVAAIRGDVAVRTGEGECATIRGEDGVAVAIDKGEMAAMMGEGGLAVVTGDRGVAEMTGLGEIAVMVGDGKGEAIGRGGSRLRAESIGKGERDIGTEEV